VHRTYGLDIETLPVNLGEPPKANFGGLALLGRTVNRGRMEPFGRGRVAAKVGEVVRMGVGQVECADE
jgi:hypothetical protein